MADSILRLRVQNEEYDNKLKRAAEGIRHLADTAHKSAGELTGLEQAELDYIKALGDMETKSRSAAGQVRELESTYKELTVVYNNLNEVEKADEGGKALAASLDKLKQRAQEAKKQLDDATKSLNSNEQASKEDSSSISDLTSKLGINIKSLAGWGAALTVSKAALDVTKDAFFASESTVDAWGRTVDASKSLYEGFLTALNTGDISGYLSNINQIVTAARAAYDELDRLGTMQTIQSPQKSSQQTELDRMRMMLQTGRYIAPIDGQKAAMKDGEKLTKDQLKNIQTHLQNGMKNMRTLIANEVKQTGKAIDAVYNRQANELGMGIKEFRKGTSSMAEFDQRMEGYRKYLEWNKNAQGEFAKQGGQGYVNFDKSNPYAEFKKWGVFRVDGDRYKQLVQLIQQRDQQASQAYSIEGQMYRAMNRADSRINPNGSTTKEQTEIQLNQKKINDLTQQYVDLSKQGLTSDDEHLVKLREEIKELEKRNGLLSKYAEQAQGRLLLKGSDIDMSGAGISKKGGLGLTNDDAVKKPAQLNDKALKALQKTMDKQLQQLIKEQNYEKKQETTVAGGIGDLAGGLGSIVGGLEQLGIEIPDGFKSAISAMQGISTILTGIATTVLAIEAIAGADAIIPFAHGGIVPHAANGFFVPGTHLSGDVTPILANAGEIILNKSQQNNLAPQLTGGGLQNLRLEAEIGAEQILLVSNNRGLRMRTARGEIVQSRRRR